MYIVLGDAAALKSAAAKLSAETLSLAGRPAQAIGASPNPIVQGDGFEAEINYYCSGALEIAVMFGAIFASQDRTLKRRAIGFAAGAVAAIAFNALRISATLYVFSYSAPMISAAFHDVLFRASIVAFVATYYAIWYYWDGGEA